MCLHVESLNGWREGMAMCAVSCAHGLVCVCRVCVCPCSLCVPSFPSHSSWFSQNGSFRPELYAELRADTA
jgi:hypothetical protein